MAQLPGAAFEAVAGSPADGRGAARAGRVPVAGQPLRPLLHPRRLRPGRHDGDHRAHQRGEGGIVIGCVNAHSDQGQVFT